MKKPVAARESLLNVARTGHTFTRDDLFHVKPGEDPNKILGRGHDYDVPAVKIVGRQGAVPYAGAAALRVVGLDKPHGQDLLLRTRLSWDTPEGSHMSYAMYIITAEGAGLLEGSAPSDDLAAEAAHVHSARWLQDYPGSMFADSGLADVDANGEYHRRAVAGAQYDYPKLLPMLSLTNSGIVRPHELGLLAEWVERHPPTAG